MEQLSCESPPVDSVESQVAQGRLRRHRAFPGCSIANATTDARYSTDSTGYFANASASSITNASGTRYACAGFFVFASASTRSFSGNTSGSIFATRSECSIGFSSFRFCCAVIRRTWCSCSGA